MKLTLQDKDKTLEFEVQKACEINTHTKKITFLKGGETTDTLLEIKIIERKH